MLEPVRRTFPCRRPRSDYSAGGAGGEDKVSPGESTGPWKHGGRAGLGRRRTGAVGGSDIFSALWTEAQELVNEAFPVAQTAWDAERTEAKKLRVELSSAFESRSAELESLRLKLAEVQTETSTAAASDGRGWRARSRSWLLTDQAHTASARAHVTDGKDLY